MATYMVGDLLYQARIEKGYSQEELSFGVCSLSSLSRIENNLQMPSKRIFDALVEKLGIPKFAYNMYISKGERELNVFSDKITRKLAALDFDNLDEIVNQFEEKIPAKDGQNYQLLLFTKALIAKHKGAEEEVILDMFLEALHLTMPGFSPETLKEYRLVTFTEISILNRMGMLFYDMGRRKIGLQLLYWLLEHMDHHLVDEEEKAKIYPIILCSISERLVKMGRIEEAYDLCERGVQMCIDFGRLYPLPYLMAYKGFAAAELGNKEEALSVFSQASALFHMLGRQQVLEQLKNEFKSQERILL